MIVDKHFLNTSMCKFLAQFNTNSDTDKWSRISPCDVVYNFVHQYCYLELGVLCGTRNHRRLTRESSVTW